MKITVIIPFCNQVELLEANLKVLAETISEPDTNILLLNNDSDKFELTTPDNIKDKIYVHTYYKNIGNYPCFFGYRDIEIPYGDILCYIHSDFILWEKGWDTKVKQAFEANPKLGLIGCIGSNEIDQAGGRGLGTASNFMGRVLEPSWQGSPAEPHGKRLTGQMKACVVDGCSMFFRKSALDRIQERMDFPPHHFYDRLLSCEIQELGYWVAVLGIECDHISGQTANTQSKWFEVANQWLRDHNLPETGDQGIYLEAERQWLSEYRDRKHMVPMRV